MSAGKIELIGRPLWRLVKVWGNVSIIPPQHTHTHARAHTHTQNSVEQETNSGSEGLYENATPLCASIKRALQSELNFLGRLLKAA